MSCGKPVIASYLGGIPEVVGNEKTCGFLWSCGNVGDLAQKMMVLAQDSQLRQSMGSAARQRVIDNFTWKNSAQTLLRTLS
jgi:glycosyltransferase involved in cell wall biosynthesis